MADEVKSPRGFRFRWWIVPAGLGGVVVIVVAVGAVILANKDIGAFKDLITAELSKETGRDVQINGAFELSIGFSPSIVAEDIVIANAPWGSRPAMLTARRLDVKVALFPILGGRVETKRLVLEGADLLLENDATGKTNWPFADAADTAKAESELLATDSLEIRDSLITLRSGRSGQTRTLKLDHAIGGLDPAANTLTLEATGAFNQRALAAKLTIGRRGPKAPLNVELKAGAVTLTLDGTIERPADFDGLDVATALSAENLIALNALVGDDSSAAPEIGPVSLKGQLTGGGNAFALDQIEGALGDTKLTGALKLAFDGDTPRLGGALAANAVDVDLLLGQTKKAKAPRGARLFGDEPIDVAWLDGADLDLGLSAQSATYRGTQISDFATTLVVRDKVAILKPLAFRLAGGALNGEARLDNTGKAPSIALRGTMRGVELREALALLEVGESGQGKIDIDADLRSVGGSPRALAGALAGRLDLAMGTGRIDNGLIDFIAADLVQSLMPWNVAQGHANVNCMVARFPVERGVMTAETLLLDTDKMTMGGDGTIDLGKERLNLRLVPKPKDPSLFSLAVPILVEGPLNNPSAAPDAEAVALGVAGSALGTLINPLGILIPFVSAGSAGENPCIAALKRPGTGDKSTAEARKRKKKPSKLGAVGDTAEGVVEGVGEGLDRIGKGIGGIFD